MDAQHNDTAHDARGYVASIARQQQCTTARRAHELDAAGEAQRAPDWEDVDAVRRAIDSTADPVWSSLLVAYVHAVCLIEGDRGCEASQKPWFDLHDEIDTPAKPHANSAETATSTPDSRRSTGAGGTARG